MCVCVCVLSTQKSISVAKTMWKRYQISIRYSLPSSLPQAASDENGNPEWQETFEFELPEEELGFRFASMTLSDLPRVCLVLDIFSHPPCCLYAKNSQSFNVFYIPKISQSSDVALFMGESLEYSIVKRVNYFCGTSFCCRLLFSNQESLQIEYVVLKSST